MWAEINAKFLRWAILHNTTSMNIAWINWYRQRTEDLLFWWIGSCLKCYGCHDSKKCTTKLVKKQCNDCIFGLVPQHMWIVMEGFGRWTRCRWVPEKTKDIGVRFFQLLLQLNKFRCWAVRLWHEDWTCLNPQLSWLTCVKRFFLFSFWATQSCTSLRSSALAGFKKMSITGTLWVEFMAFPSLNFEDFKAGGHFLLSKWSINCCWLIWFWKDLSVSVASMQFFSKALVVSIFSFVFKFARGEQRA